MPVEKNNLEKYIVKKYRRIYFIEIDTLNENWIVSFKLYEWEKSQIHER